MFAPVVYGLEKFRELYNHELHAIRVGAVPCVCPLSSENPANY